MCYVIDSCCFVSLLLGTSIKASVQIRIYSLYIREGAGPSFFSQSFFALFLKSARDLITLCARV